LISTKNKSEYSLIVKEIKTNNVIEYQSFFIIFKSHFATLF